MRFRHHAMALSALAFTLLHANRSQADDLDRFRAILKNPEMQGHLVQGARTSTVMLQQPCAAGDYKLLPHIVMLLPPVFDGSQLIRGAWKTTVEMRGCETSRLLNVLASVTAPKSLKVSALLPGTTRADPLLQKDGVRYAAVSVTGANGGPQPDCHIGYVENTEFVRINSDPPRPGSKGRSWSETWTLVSCTAKSKVQMRFIPDAKGTAIAAGPVKVEPLGK